MLIQNPLAEFTIILLLILIAPVLAKHLRLPELVFLLILGAILGPYGAQILQRGDAVRLYGDIGKLYIMFLAGLEIDQYQFKKNGHRSGIFGLLTFLIPQIAGTFIILFFFDFSTKASILIASMFASHTLLAYPVATRLGIAKSEPVAVTVGATVVTDTLALIVLAVIADKARGASPGPLFWITIFGGLGVLSSTILILIPRVTRYVFRKVSEEGNTQFLFVLAVTCGFSYLSNWARMEPIIGAFFCGIAFSRLIPEHSVLMTKINFAGNSLFIPFFLLSSGMLINPAVLVGDQTSIKIAIVMSAAVVGTKLLASISAGLIFKYPLSAIPLMFGLSVPQAAATLAAAMVGFELGIFDSTILNGTMAMILVSCPLGSIVVEKAGRAYARSLENEPAGPPRNQRVLVPVTHPDSASNLVDLALLLRLRGSEYEIHPLAVVTDDLGSEEAVAKAESLLAHCVNHGAGAEQLLIPEMRLANNPVDGISTAAKEIRAGLVITGWSREQRVSSKFFGTLAGSLVDSCPSRLIFTKIVSPLPLSKRLFLLFPPLAEERADRKLILLEAKNLAQQLGVDINIYTVVDQSHPFRKEIDDILGVAVHTTVRNRSSWSDIKKDLFLRLSDSDSLLVALERNHGRYWSPSVDHFPEKLIERYPKNNLIVIYPAMACYSEELLMVDRSNNSEKISIEPISIKINSFSDIMTGLIQCTATDWNTAKELEEMLISCASSYPVELLPEVTLLHAHTPAVTRPRIFMHLFQNSQKIDPLEGGSKAIIIVLNPIHGDAQRHLKTLAKLAGLFSDTIVQKSLFESATTADFIKSVEDRELNSQK